MAQSWFFNLQRVRASSVRPFWKSDTVAFSMSALGNRFQIRISPKIDLSISLWCVPKRLSTSWHLCLFCWRRVGTPVVMTSRGNNPLRSLCAFPRTHRNMSPSIPMSLRKQSGARLNVKKARSGLISSLCRKLCCTCSNGLRAVAFAW